MQVFLFVLPWQTIWIFRPAFINGIKWEYGTLGFYGTEILLWVIVCVFMWWYWQQLRHRTEDIRFKITSDRIFVFSLLLFTFYFLLSTLWSVDKDLALNKSLHVLEAILFFLIIFIGPFKIAELKKWLIYGAVAPSILGIWQFLMQSTFAFKWLGLASHPVWEAGTSIIQSDAIGRWLRAYGPFNHPNIFGGYLVIIIVIFLHYDIVNLRKDIKDKNNVFFLISYILCLTSLFFTFSRSAWIALLIGLLIYLFFCFSEKYPPKDGSSLVGDKVESIKDRWVFVLLPIIIFFLLSTLYFPLVTTRASIQSVSEIRSIEERVGGYNEAWQIFKKHSLVGVGAGNYTVALYQTNPNLDGWVYQPVHNVVVLFVVEEGVVGMVLFLFVILSLVRLMTCDIRNKDINCKDILCPMSYVLCFMSYILSLMPLVFFDHYLYSSYAGLVLGGVFFALIYPHTNSDFISKIS